MPTVQTFRRMPFFYWADRILLTMIFFGMGILCFGARPAPLIVPIVGIICFAFGVWACIRPHPTRIEVDAKEVRIFFRPYRLVSIPRADIIKAQIHGTTKGYGAAIDYRDGEKVRFVNLQSQYFGPKGEKIFRGDLLCRALNDAMGIVQ